MRYRICRQLRPPAPAARPAAGQHDAPARQRRALRHDEAEGCMIPGHAHAQIRDDQVAADRVIAQPAAEWNHSSRASSGDPAAARAAVPGSAAGQLLGLAAVEHTGHGLVIGESPGARTTMTRHSRLFKGMGAENSAVARSPRRRQRGADMLFHHGLARSSVQARYAAATPRASPPQAADTFTPRQSRPERRSARAG